MVFALLLALLRLRCHLIFTLNFNFYLIGPGHGVKLTLHCASSVAGTSLALFPSGKWSQGYVFGTVFVLNCIRGWEISLTASGAVLLARLKAQVWVMGFHKKHPGRATPLSLSQFKVTNCMNCYVSIIEPVG